MAASEVDDASHFEVEPFPCAVVMDGDRVLEVHILDPEQCGRTPIDAAGPDKPGR